MKSKLTICNVSLLFVVLLTGFFVGCIDPEEDATALLPDFGSGQISISELRRTPIETVIEDDFYISATVISDPSHKNFPEGYIFVQDNSSKGICILVDNADEYSFGDLVEIKVMGSKLIVDKNGLSLLSDVIKTNILKKESTKKVAPTTIVASDLPMYESTYVRLEAQVIQRDVEKSFAGETSFETSYGRRFIVFAYDQAVFSNVSVPSLYGYIEGVVSMIGGRRVLLPLNTSSYLGLTDERIIPPTPKYTISEVREMEEGEVLDEIEVIATVVSDYSDKNFLSKYLYVQDMERGMIIECDVDHSLMVGQNITVNIEGATVNHSVPFKLTNIDSSKITLNGNPQAVEPIDVTVKQLEGDVYESMYVRISDVQAMSTNVYGKFEGDVTFENNTGDKFKVYTSAESIRKEKTVPPASGSVSGVVTGTGDNVQLSPRTNSDFNIPGKGIRLNGEEVMLFVADDSKDLFISEVVHGVAADGSQVTAVELYNPTSRELDLTNYMVAMIYCESNTDLVSGIPRQTFDNVQEFPRKLKSGETLVIISTLALEQTGKFVADNYSYYISYPASPNNILNNKGNSPFVLLKKIGEEWLEVDRVGVPNELDQSKLKPGETDIDSFSGKYSSNPAAASKLERGWLRGRSWLRNPGVSASPGEVNHLSKEALELGSWSAIEDKRAQYKQDIANKGNDPRNGGWTMFNQNSATSAGSALANTTLGWHEYSVPLQQ